MNDPRPYARNSTFRVREHGIAKTPFPRPATENGEPIRWSSFARRDGVVLTAPPALQRRSSPETGFPRSVKLDVRKRAGRGDPDDARCEACGRWLGRCEGEVQHRAARGSGGCADEVINGIANAVLLCGHGAAPIRSGCHGACEDREPHMAMDAGGFWIKHGTTPAYDPRNVAIMLHGAGGGGMTVWLNEAGGYSFQAPDGAAW